MIEYERAERLSLKAHPELNEKWVQELIAADPSILGLGELELRQRSGFSHALAVSIFSSRIQIGGAMKLRSSSVPLMKRI
jgi:hypothetical protein